jgi:endonuclease/exonuclease/phosphatase family metal-dependent hydrolase
MRVPSQSSLINSLSISSVSQITGRSFNHTYILFLNPRSIKSKKYEFLNYSEANNIPITLINETQLQPETKFKFPNYVTYRPDRLNQRGDGTAILVCIYFKDFRSPPPPATYGSDSYPIQYQQRIHIINFYLQPPRQNFERDLELIIGNGNKIILAGYFNAKHIIWNGRQNNAAGQILLNHYHKSNYVISAPSNPTHFPDSNSADADILDFAVISNVLSRHSVLIQGSLSSSDHNPVLLTIRSPQEADEIKQTFVCSEANWDLFQN